MHCPFEQTFDASAHGAASEHAADMQSPEAAQISPAPHDDTEHGAMHVPLTHKFERHSAFSAHGVPFVFCASEDSPQPAAANDNADKTRIARFNRIETSLCETEPGLKSGYTDIQIEYKANRRMTADCAEKTGIAPSIFLDFPGKRRAVRQKKRIGTQNYSHCPVAGSHDGAQYWLSAGKKAARPSSLYLHTYRSLKSRSGSSTSQPQTCHSCPSCCLPHNFAHMT